MIINKSKNYKKIIITCITILLLFLIIIILVKYSQYKKQQKYIIQEKERVRQYTSLTDFKSIEEVAVYLNCKFIEQKESNTEQISYDVFMELPVKYVNINDTNSQSSTENKNFTENLIQYSAYVLKYKNFRIVDEKNNISIIVICNEEQQLVSTYSINNVTNYFEILQNEEELNNYKKTETVKIDVSSEELNNIIKNNWDYNNIQLGTKESTYRNYDIYFNEGIQVRSVAGKVFNIVFTDRYQNEVFKNIKVNSSKESIEEILGKPQFESGNLIGYKSENLYAFFYNDQISVYRVEKYDTDKFAEIVENKSSNNENERVFVDEIKKIWNDYDIYEYNENSVKLQYTLKGLTIKFDSSNKKGVILYNNYKGKVYGSVDFEQILTKDKPLPDYVFVENKDLVFEEEQNRVNRLDDSTENNNFPSFGVINNTSKKFKTYKKLVNSDEKIYMLRFISIDDQNPNSELREYMCNGIWLDDYNFVYSVKNRGIFIYNAEQRTYKTVITGSGHDYYINGIIGNKLKYDKNYEVDIVTE